MINNNIYSIRLFHFFIRNCHVQLQAPNFRDFTSRPTISQHRLLTSSCFLYISCAAPISTFLNGRFALFVQEFIEEFFPDLYPYIDFSDVTFLEQEVYLDYLKGPKREIDILAAVKLHQEDKILHIHTEPQSTHEADFPERMFLYFAYLYAKHRKPIQPIAVLSYNRKQEEPTQFKINTPIQEVLQFNYLKLQLRHKNWREYIKSDNPAAAALMSQMGYEEDERVQVKLEFLRMITRMKINPSKKAFLYGYFEVYLKLSSKEEKQLTKEMESLPKEEKEEVMQLPNSYFERGLEKGKEEGRQEGMEKEKQIVLKLIGKGMSISEVAEITEYSESEIKKLTNK